MDLSAVDLVTETVRTERLVLRPYRADDVAPVHRACQDPEIQRWIGQLPVPYTRDSARAFVEEVAPGERSAGTGLTTAVEADGELVGSAGAYLRPGRLGPEIGYWVAPWARGQGYAAEAAHALAEWALGLGAPRVHLFVDVGNAASQAVARRAGFRDEGVVRAALDHRDGGRRDAVLFGRLPGD
ncbi:GNAT family N-acetyltransferase [Blastococcus sp. TF02A-35]|uniref:GNAT family N-acetyltransferase n=1 Tax=Blastococcus sp. TF02A-35 TaxID=2559612 RepID=UPI00107315DE|nr:GNAT family N-acetyltransferase [Blastococcus sp. TF02A_35]TFV52294.1 N-acetyltransferase [Blastococcus sp. TF02A_35]